MTSWVPGADGSLFGVDNLPYGVFSAEGRPRVGVAVGEWVLDVGALASADGLGRGG